MKLGIAIPTFSGTIATPLDAADRAAAVDADAVFAVDHLFPPGRPARPSFEPFSLLAAVVAAHPGLGVGALVARVGMRPPGLLAKQAASLHEMSGGRAILGLGMGDALVRAEHETFGLPFPPAPDRVDMARATAGALRSLFAGRRWSGDDRLPPLDGPLLPQGGPPVWLGGTSDRMVRVAAGHGDAWNGWGLDLDGFLDRVDLLRREAREAGRDLGEVPPTWGGIILVARDRAELARLEADRSARGAAWDPWRGTADDLRAFASGLARAGATWMVCLPAGPPDRTELIARTLAEA
jgi:alkanesulfonate monooxygenase SsuD/methylene tetrahydromethanopterin reductase-like flavin-dependent oxidoreductase (luciferase family)